MWMAKSFKWKFTNFSIHPSLILQKNFLTHVNLVKHLVASIITTALFFCTQQMLSPVVRCMLALMEIAFVSTTSIVSLSKGCLLSFPSVLTKLYLTSISKVGSRLCTRKNGEKFVEVCLLTLSANKTPLIILNQSHGLPSKTLTNFFFFFDTPILSFPFDWGWYTEVISCSVPIMLCETLLTSYTNCFLGL